MTENRKRFHLEITNLPDDINEILLKKAAEETLQYFTTPAGNLPFLIMVHFVLPEEMKEINRQFKKRDSSTDVLSFPYHEEYETEEQTFQLLGEIFLETKTIGENAKKYNASFQRELLYIFIHGLLHLAGYTHEEETSLKSMITLQNKILEKIQ